MPNPSPRPARRDILKNVAIWWSAAVAALASPLAWFVRRPSRARPLDPARIPVWHPAASGFHQDGRMTLRLVLPAAQRREKTLKGLHPRLWCLCGGRLSETALANTLAIEEGLDADHAARLVSRFLEPLYRQGYLLPSRPELLTALDVRETEGSVRLGEALWLKNTL